MKLIVDSGSTKTDWIALDDNGNKLFETQTLQQKRGLFQNVYDSIPNQCESWSGKQNMIYRKSCNFVYSLNVNNGFFIGHFDSFIPLIKF